MTPSIHGSSEWRAESANGTAAARGGRPTKLLPHTHHRSRMLGPHTAHLTRLRGNAAQIGSRRQPLYLI